MSDTTPATVVVSPSGKRPRSRPRNPETAAEQRRRAEHGPRTIPSVLQRLHERGVIELTEGQLRRAVKLGEVKTVPFGGLPRIPLAEEDRLVALLGQGTAIVES